MKPATAAKKLGIHLPSTPEEFQQTPLTREAFQELQASPPEWLVQLRLTGPHPKQEVARKLGVSTSGLVRAGVTDALTTEQIRALLEDQPEWLRQERATQAQVRADAAYRKKAAADAAARG
ncbi:DUF5997 family protein [Schumannella soli]|uniref:Uncharacterized protein n=1 Tax=Schumannella soli TaxID=2590779 RepID=A0A506Y4Z0_9MICO|nr:DUF5997 family protein [Schumannella soli]TPW76620.1 hypothetical protein FJ657_09465 [Schumannella soli]